MSDHLRSPPAPAPDERKRVADLGQPNRRTDRTPSERSLEPAVLTQFYRYNRIDNADDTRLLVLEPGKKCDRTLSGSLMSHKVTELREYKALSYVWGPPQFTNVIFLDEKQRLAITESLGAALRRLRPLPGKPPLRIWVDQICINQKDTVERSQQVGLMHAIFKNASQVCVWLGTDRENHACRAFQFAEALRSIFGDPLLSKLVKSQGEDCDWIPPEYWESLRTLTSHPWFRRVWIPQKIGTDAKAMV